MTKLRNLVGALLLSVAVAAGTIGFAPAANAQSDNPCPPIDFVLVYADMTGAAYSIDNKSIVDFGAGGEFLLGPCVYEGDMYYSAGGNGTSPQGKYRFQRPLNWHL